MFRDTYSWVSRRVGHDMRVERFGDRGTPVLYAPSSGGDATEFEAYGMDRVARPWIDAGGIQVFAVDGRGPATFWDDRLPPEGRVAGYVAVEAYLKDEVLPWIREVTGAPGTVAVGCSYGGMVAANLFLKLPDVVPSACGLGGVYGLWHRLDGHHDDDVYFHTPLEFLPRLRDRGALGALRATRGFEVFAAADDPWRAMSDRFVSVLHDRGVPHRYDVWPSPADHHERWWCEQWKAFLARRFGVA